MKKEMTLEHKPIQQRYKDDMARLEKDNIEAIKSVVSSDTSNKRRETGAKLNINVNLVEPTTKRSGFDI